MDRRLQLESRSPVLSESLVYGALALCGLYWLLDYLGVLAPHELLFNAVVYCIPTPLLLDSARRHELKANNMLSQTHAAKSDAFRRMLGVGGNALLQGGEFTGVGSVMRRASMGTKFARVTSDAPAGLGNWDNSCYQNSVLQALASLESVKTWLSNVAPPGVNDATTTNAALQEMIAKLTDPDNNGRHIWTSAKLKNMSSWQQQDAQEYFSKVVDELDKEAAKVASLTRRAAGLATLVERELREQEPNDGTERVPDSAQDDGIQQSTIWRCPLEGMAAQRITCTRCGFSEGYSMIPFNCLTVPLGSLSAYDIEDCLEEYTKSEDIEGVECRSCTLINAKDRLQRMLPANEDDSSNTPSSISLPPEVRIQVEGRLRIIQEAWENDDFSDKTVKQDCQITAKAMVSSTKTREAKIGRAPQSLAIHVNRSVFDEMTGMQRKNYSIVRYPFLLDLKPWMLDTGDCPTQYSLKAVVTHYGRHENGHYICYKKHPKLVVGNDKQDADADVAQKESWWRLSDEDVSPISEQDVLDQGGVFMLFYERLEASIIPPTPEWVDASTVALPVEDAQELEDGIEATEAASEAVCFPLQAIVSEVKEEEAEAPVPSTPEQSTPRVPMPQPLLRTASPKFVRHSMGMSRSLMSV